MLKQIRSPEMTLLINQHWNPPVWPSVVERHNSCFSGLTKYFNVGVVSDTVLTDCFSFKVCMIKILIDIYLRILFFMTLTSFQDHGRMGRSCGKLYFYPCLKLHKNCRWKKEENDLCLTVLFSMDTGSVQNVTMTVFTVVPDRAMLKHCEIDISSVSISPLPWLPIPQRIQYKFNTLL